MFKTSFRTSLLLTSALFLVMGCDQKTDEDQTQQSNTEAAVDFYNEHRNDAPKPTLSGNFLAGQFAQDRADWSNASNYFSNILNTNPENEEIKRRVMALDMGSGNYDEAMALAQEILKSNNGDLTLAHLLLGIQHFKNKQYDLAAKEIENYSSNGLNVAILPLLQAWADAAQGKANLSLLKDSPSLLYQSVLIAAYIKDKATITDLAKTYDFTKTPTPIDRLEDVATIFSTFGEKEEARHILNTLKSAIPSRSSYYSDKLKEVDSDISTPPLKQISTPQFALSEALFDMSKLLSNGYTDTAQLFTHMALYLNPENDSALELLAQISANNNLYKEAILYLSRIDTTNNPDKEIQIVRQTAQLMTEAEQPDEAIRILKDLVATHKNVNAQIQIGDIYRSQENYPDAIIAYNDAFSMLGNKITAEYWDLSFSRGMVNEQLKNWDQAEKDLQTALLYEPDQPYVLNYLAYSWADQGKNLDKAAEMIEKAVRLKPNDGAIVDSLGWVYFKMGKFEKAVSTLEKAIELSPTEAEINDHLGDAYWRVGRKSEAKFQWKRAASFSKNETSIANLHEKIDAGLPDILSSTDTKATETIIGNK